MPSAPNNQQTKLNQKAWNANRYNAWITAFGSADAEAHRILANPQHAIRRVLPYLDAIEGKQICNVQGSHGRVAVSLAVLGADVHVIDFSEENRRFALELAEAANVSIDYFVCDILEADKLDLPIGFDVLVLELGILHYHQDITRFFAVMQALLKDGSMLVLNEFHPVQRKLHWGHGPQNYFSENLIEADVPNPDPTGASLGKCQYRFWTLGQIMTAIINNGFSITHFDEHPDPSHPDIPGSFTLVGQI